MAACFTDEPPVPSLSGVEKSLLYVAKMLLIDIRACCCAHGVAV